MWVVIEVKDPVVVAVATAAAATAAVVALVVAAAKATASGVATAASVIEVAVVGGKAINLLFDKYHVISIHKNR